MKDWVKYTLAGLSMLGFLAVVQMMSCSPAINKMVAKDVIDLVLAKCIEQHAEIQDLPVAKKLCQIDEQATPAVEEFLTARRQAVAKAKASNPCSAAPSKDGGL